MASLRRELGLTSAVCLVAGIMIGSGIFMSPQFVLAYVGAPGTSLVIWAACGCLTMCAALCYAEMGTIIRESGGDYIYILHIYGPWPAFCVAYTVLFALKPSGIAASSLSFAGYAVAPFYQGCMPPPLVVKCVAASCILVIATVNMLHVRLSLGIQVVFTAAKLVGLVLIVGGGIVTLAQGNFGSLSSVENAFSGSRLGISPVGMSLYQCLWSYAGWYNLNYVTEELKRPEVNLPRALLIAIPMVTVLYLLVNVSYLVVLTPAEMISSSAVAVTWGNKVFGGWGWLMSVAAALSAFGSLNGSFFSGGRVCYVAAREGHMPDVLAMAHVHRLTPSPALIFTTVLSLILIIPGDFKSIVNFFSFSAWFFYGVTLSGLLYLKIKKPEIHRPIKVPFILPLVVLVAAVLLVLAPIIDEPQIEYLYVTLFILSATLIYLPFIHFRLFPGVLNRLTTFLQLFLEVAPTQKNL